MVHKLLISGKTRYHYSTNLDKRIVPSTFHVSGRNTLSSAMPIKISRVQQLFCQFLMVRGVIILTFQLNLIYYLVRAVCTHMYKKVIQLKRLWHTLIVKNSHTFSSGKIYLDNKRHDSYQTINRKS